MPARYRLAGHRAGDLTISRQQTFSGTKEPHAAVRIDAGALAVYMATAIEGFAGPLAISQFKGGQSNPTYRLDAASGTYVLRRKPPGKLLASAHAVEREFKVISALHKAGFAVPRPYVLCEDESVAGTVFYIMGYCKGRVFWEPHMPSLSASARAAVFDQLNTTIARLHAFDHTALGLADFGRPQGYVARQIARWSAQYKASETVKITAMDKLMDWLPDAAPDNSEVCLVHGDFRLDNCIVHAGKPEIIAVLDWELSTIGDPLADFTYHLMQWRMPQSTGGAGVGTLAGHEHDAPGVPLLEDYVADYCARTGRTGIGNLDIYMAYNFFRLAAIYQGIAGRVRDGTAASPQAGQIADLVQPMAAVAWDYAGKAGA